MQRTDGTSTTGRPDFFFTATLEAVSRYMPTSNPPTVFPAFSAQTRRIDTLLRAACAIKAHSITWTWVPVTRLHAIRHHLVSSQPLSVLPRHVRLLSRLLPPWLPALIAFAAILAPCTHRPSHRLAPLQRQAHPTNQHPHRSARCKTAMRMESYAPPCYTHHNPSLSPTTHPPIHICLHSARYQLSISGVSPHRDKPQGWPICFQPDA